MKMSWVFGFLDLAWTKGLDLGPVGTGNWGLGLGLDNFGLRPSLKSDEEQPHQTHTTNFKHEGVLQQKQRV